MYRQGRNYENLNIALYGGTGTYDVPEVLPCDDVSVQSFIGFNYVKGCNDAENKGVHFFLDDYQFNRVWDDVGRYVESLKRFPLVFAPDFSMYQDFPKAIQVYNHYRRMWLARYWQDQGINVVSVPCWSDKSSYEWCFEGHPTHTVLATSSVGTQVDPDAYRGFLEGYTRMCEVLEPTKMYFYGHIPKELKNEKIIVPIEAFGSQMRKRIKEKSSIDGEKDR